MTERVTTRAPSCAPRGGETHVRGKSQGPLTVEHQLTGAPREARKASGGGQLKILVTASGASRLGGPQRRRRAPAFVGQAGGRGPVSVFPECRLTHCDVGPPLTDRGNQWKRRPPRPGGPPIKRRCEKKCKMTSKPGPTRQLAFHSKHTTSFAIESLPVRSTAPWPAVGRLRWPLLEPCPLVRSTGLWRLRLLLLLPPPD